jgi:hypothetical protein
MARMRSLVVATATLAALAAPTTASAATATCNTLQDALDNAALHETVTLEQGQQCHQHYTLPSQSITLTGGGTSATLTGQGKGNFQILQGDNVGDTTISNLTFLEGEDFRGGAIQLYGDSPAIIENNTFTGNVADEGDGGAIYVDLNQNTVELNGRGDALPLIIRDNDFGGEGANTATGGGGAVYVTGFFRDVVVQDNSFTGNEANNRGGGLYVDASHHLLLDGNDFDDNEAEVRGGGAFVDNTCTLDVTDNVFQSNELRAGDTSMYGGGLFAAPGQSCFSDLQARGGTFGAELVQSGNLFDSNEIQGDQFSSGFGGGEAVFAYRVQSTDDRFVENKIDAGNLAWGGGFYQEQAPIQTPFVARNLVATGNVASAQVTQPPAARSEVPQDSRGGGLYLSGRSDEFRIEDSTIVNNTAVIGPGIDGPFGGQDGIARGVQVVNALVLYNSIVFGNGVDSENINGFGSRDVQFSDTCVENAAATGEGNICLEPGLIDGSRRGTVDQVATSPTVNAGNSALVAETLTKDYAGDARIIDTAVDMGADEYKPPAKPQPKPPVVTPTPPAAAPPAQAVQGVQQKSCKSKRSFRIRIRVPRGKKAKSATVRVNGKKVKVVRGKRLRSSVKLTGLPKGRFSVRITVRLTNGKKITGVRRYHTCIPKRPGDGPPKV